MDTVYLTEGAYRDIVLETAEHPGTETGGILLGEATAQGWFVVEVLDPGPRAVRSAVTFEYNHTYATHLANKVARRYQAPLRLLGLWHRHPGSLDSFSCVDDETHREYLRICRGGVVVSGLVNIDPDFRMTFYRVDHPLRYTRIPVVVGDEHFPPPLLQRKDPAEVVRKLRRPPARRQPPREIQIEYLPLPAERPSLAGRILGAVNPFRAARPAEDPAPVYRPYEGEGPENAGQRKPSDDQKQFLDLLDSEFDYLDERGETFEYRISPQEPGYRLEVTLRPVVPPPPYPALVEFDFYYRQDMPVAAVEGREQPYRPGLLRRWYGQFDPPPSLPAPAAQEHRHEGPPADRPLS